MTIFISSLSDTYSETTEQRRVVASHLCHSHIVTFIFISGVLQPRRPTVRSLLSNEEYVSYKDSKNTSGSQCIPDGTAFSAMYVGNLFHVMLSLTILSSYKNQRTHSNLVDPAVCLQAHPSFRYWRQKQRVFLCRSSHLGLLAGRGIIWNVRTR